MKHVDIAGFTIATNRGFKYAAYNSKGFIYFFKNKPTIIDGSWEDDSAIKICEQIVDNPSDWKNSLREFK